MAFAIILVTIAIVVAIWLYTRWSGQKEIYEFERRNVKIVKMTNPLWAVWRKQRMELEKDELIKREGKIWGFNMMNSVTILVGEPELVQLVLSKEFTNFTNRRIFKVPDPILGNMLSNAEDEQWKRLRSMMTPTFSSGSLRRMKPRIDCTIRMLIENCDKTIGECDQIDMKRLYGAYAMDTIIQVAFGVNVDSLAEPNNPIIVYAKKSFSQDMGLKAICAVMFLLFLPKLAQKCGFRYRGDITDFFKEFSLEIIQRKKEELAANKNTIGKASTFLELLLEAEEESKRQQLDPNEDQSKKSAKYMSTDEMIAQCILFFLAGYETSSTTMTMASYLLALHPEAQEKLHQEINTVLAKLAKESPNKTTDPVELVTFENMSQFEYLSAVIDETLRIYPPATATERQASKDIVIQSEDGVTRINVKKGDVIHIPIYSMHFDEEQFPNAQKFEPERFVGEPSFHKYAYLPFGSGPRNCVAKSLALLEAKLALLHTARLFKFSKCEQTKVPIELYYQANFITPKDVILKVEKR